MDFDYLQGDFDVAGRRLRDPLDPDSGWIDMPATSAATVLLGGAVSVDEMWFPTEHRFGMSLRLYEPDDNTWTVRWLDERGLQPPVRGRWEADRCWFTGPERYQDRDVLVSYSWHERTSSGARWEQCFSVDEGRSWQPNWCMSFTRRRDPVEHPRTPRIGGDFDFLTGSWQVHHIRQTDPVDHALGGASAVQEWSGEHRGRTFFAGAVSVDETTLAEPGHYGLALRVFDRDRQQWAIHWVDNRRGRLEPAVHGRFADGIGIFEARERIDGHDVEVRFVWSDITATTARWTQSFRIGDGDWDENWQMWFTREQPA